MTHAARIMQGADSQIRFALVSYQDERRGCLSDDQQRLFEARVEPGEIRQIGEMLAVSVDDDMRKSELFHFGAEVVDPDLQFGGGWRRWAGGDAEFRPLDFN